MPKYAHIPTMLLGTEPTCPVSSNAPNFLMPCSNCSEPSRRKLKTTQYKVKHAKFPAGGAPLKCNELCNCGTGLKLNINIISLNECKVLFPVTFSGIYKPEKSAFASDSFSPTLRVHKSLDLWTWFGCEFRLGKR